MYNQTQWHLVEIWVPEGRYDVEESYMTPSLYLSPVAEEFGKPMPINGHPERYGINPDTGNYVIIRQ